MSREERILDFIRREGPLLPNRLARFLGTDLIIAGAHLAEMSSRKVVLITNLKVGGGSPIYYLPGDEEKLMRFYDELNDKDKRAYDLLKEKKILRENDLDALTRVSLRNIKDFAKPLQVNIKGQREIFWKWYLIKNEGASGLIKELLKPKVEVKKEVEEKKEPTPEPPKEGKPLVKVERKEEEIETREGEKPSVSQKQKVSEKPKVVVKKEIKKPAPEPQPEEKQEVLKKEIVKPKKEIKSDFLEKVKNYLNLKNIKIVETDVLRKTEINLILSVPTAIGEILYYAKAKSKKKCNDKDVSSAFLEGQMKKLPVLFLYGGEITKKAEEMLQQDIFKNLILLYLD